MEKRLCGGCNTALFSLYVDEGDEMICRDGASHGDLLHCGVLLLWRMVICDVFSLLWVEIVEEEERV